MSFDSDLLALPAPLGRARELLLPFLYYRLTLLLRGETLEDYFLSEMETLVPVELEGLLCDQLELELQLDCH